MPEDDIVNRLIFGVLRRMLDADDKPHNFPAISIKGLRGVGKTTAIISTTSRRRVVM